ncbi:MAG TPA: carbamate kinase [Chloroflexota bacterium]|nr:carbamate kinase [Chloroflexota bacterium]
MADFLVVAFGGNAIASGGAHDTIEAQRERVRAMSRELGRLVLAGHRVVVTHGNGPQVGEILLWANASAAERPALPLDVAGAMSQGQIGYLLQQEIGNYLTQNGRPQMVCSLVTQVIVDPADPAFEHPTKPIGRFYAPDEAAQLQKANGWVMVEDAGRGYRRVVPSPYPREIVEWPAVRSLADQGSLVIAAGGGGVPVVVKEGRLVGVEAVIDKDFASRLLANLIGARTLVLLTGVDRVAVDFGTPQQRALDKVDIDTLRRYEAEGQFPAGSMGPKVRAAIEFVERGGERALITSPERLVDAATGQAGTRILAERESRLAREGIA